MFLEEHQAASSLESIPCFASDRHSHSNSSAKRLEKPAPHPNPRGFPYGAR